MSGTARLKLHILRATRYGNFNSIKFLADKNARGIAKSIEKMQLFAEETDALATALFSETYQLNYDQDGRVSLPGSLMKHAGLKDKVTFAGIGQKFQMWEPSAFESFKTDARIKALQNRDLIGPSVNFSKNTQVKQF